MLDRSADPGALRIRPRDVARHRLAFRLLAMDCYAYPYPPDAARSRRSDTHDPPKPPRPCSRHQSALRAALRPVIRRRVAHPLGPDEAMPSIDPDMAFIAKGRHRQIVFASRVQSVDVTPKNRKKLNRSRL